MRHEVPPRPSIEPGKLPIRCLGLPVMWSGRTFDGEAIAPQLAIVLRRLPNGSYDILPKNNAGEVTYKLAENGDNRQRREKISVSPYGVAGNCRQSELEVLSDEPILSPEEITELYLGAHANLVPGGINEANLKMARQIIDSYAADQAAAAVLFRERALALTVAYL